MQRQAINLKMLTKEIIAASFKVALADLRHPSTCRVLVLLGHAPLLWQEHILVRHTITS